MGEKSMFKNVTMVKKFRKKNIRKIKFSKKMLKQKTSDCKNLISIFKSLVWEKHEKMLVPVVGL